MKYNYEPLIEDDFNYAYPLYVKLHEEESITLPHRMYMDGIDFRFDDWQHDEFSKIMPVFEKDYNSLMKSETYFFGCSFDIYNKTYLDRLTTFLVDFPDAEEVDFCVYELKKDVYYISSELLTEKIRFSIKKRNQFLNDKKTQLTTQSQQIETEQTKETINETEQKLPYKIALLHELGFFKLDAIKKLTKEKQYKVIGALTGGTPRTIKGNVLVLDPDSNEDRMRYTSNNYTDEVKNYLDKLK